MKIGILTHYNVSSHGALLQMFGLKKKLEQMGHEVYILTYTRNLDFADEKTKKRFSASMKNISYYLSSYMDDNGIKCLFYQFKKQKILKDFRDKHFTMIPYTESSKLDCVIVGADEVFALENGVNFVMFGHGITAKKIIAYAPSAGQTDIKRVELFGCRELMSSGLKKFVQLSARDFGTQNLIKDLTGLSVPIVCDPALLYNFSNSIINERKKYIVVYSYQSNFKDIEIVNKIKENAKKRNCELWSVGVYYKWCDKQINCDPLGMIDIFSKAEAVITDTFHGTITSYIAHTPMAVFVRNNNNNKLDHLLSIMSIRDRKVKSANELESVLNSSINFEKIDDTIKKLRKIGEDYLTNAIEN